MVTVSTLREQAERLWKAGRSLAQKTELGATGKDLIPSEDAANWDARARALLSQQLLPRTYLERYGAGYKTLVLLDDQQKGLGVLVALIADIDDGHLPSIGATAHAYTLSDLLDQADQMLDDPERSVAAVMLGGGVLEAHLRFVGEGRGITIQGDSALGKWNEALCNAGAYDKSMRHTIEGWTKMRNDADHLKVQKFERPAVQSLLVGVRGLMQTLPQ